MKALWEPAEAEDPTEVRGLARNVSSYRASIRGCRNGVGSVGWKVGRWAG